MKPNFKFYNNKKNNFQFIKKSKIKNGKLKEFLKVV